jgi:hypothetical protein
MFTFNPKAWHYINQIVAIYNEKGQVSFQILNFQMIVLKFVMKILKIKV